MYLKEKKALYLEQAKKYFPELEFSSHFAIYSGEEPESADITLKNESTAFKNKYKFKNRFVHYTSIDALFSILTSQELRLYNCNNLNDDFELTNSLEKLGFEMVKEDMKKFRNEFFVFSANEVLNDENIEDFNLWRLYGDNGNGVAIEFEILNSEDSWDNVFYGKVSYGAFNNSYDEMKSFVGFHQEFNKKYGLFNNIPSIIPAIAFHFKDEIWNVENEIRLIAHCSFDQNDFSVKPFRIKNNILNYTIKHVLNKSGKPTAYVSLPLILDEGINRISEVAKDEQFAIDFYKCIPHLKINKIILGYNRSFETLMNLEELVCRIYNDKKYARNIRVSHSKYFKK
jgi:hypothetical protein